MKKKFPFLDRLTNTSDVDRVLDDEHEFGDDDDLIITSDPQSAEEAWEEPTNDMTDNGPQDGELPVDMYQTDDAIVIRAIVAGVTPSDLEISITRDMVTIRGVRDEYQEARDDNYFHRELFWGSFSRNLLLPEEVIIDESEATEKHGMLEIRMPKLDKHRSTQLQVKSGGGQK